MMREERLRGSAEERIDAYLRRFKSTGDYTTRAHTALDEYLLERAAKELRAAQRRLDRFRQEIGRS